MELKSAMVADAATVAPDGKLYVLGGQWDQIFVANFPSTHPTMAIVLVVEVPYDQAFDEHEISVSLMRDGQQVGPRALGKMQTGHAPTLERGASSYVSLALPFHQVTFDAPGRFEWVVEADGEPLGSIPLAVSAMPWAR